LDYTSLLSSENRFDLPGEVAWGCNDKFLAGRSSIGTGSQNTIDIASGCSVAGNAATLCSNLNQGGYDDWYLPSKDELNKLFLQMKVIGGFREVCYWSSTETGPIDGLGQQFGVPCVGCIAIGSQGELTKSQATTINVRPVRAFG
jgi:hypothetical protein